MRHVQHCLQCYSCSLYYYNKPAVVFEWSSRTEPHTAYCYSPTMRWLRQDRLSERLPNSGMTTTRVAATTLQIWRISRLGSATSSTPSGARGLKAHSDSGVARLNLSLFFPIQAHTALGTSPGYWWHQLASLGSRGTTGYDLHIDKTELWTSEPPSSLM